jgi:hypothetical protein
MGFRHKLRLLDFWWHLKIGEIITETESIPRTDMFSYTVDGTTFVLQNWLTEILYYLLYRIGGLELLIVANTLILVGALIPIYHLCWDSLRQVRPTVLTVSFAVLALAGVYSNVRPQTVSFLFFAIFYWILLRYSRKQPSFLWVLPLLMVLWVNLHGAFVLGLGMILLFFLSEGVRRMMLGERPDTLSAGQLKILLLIFILTGIASLANPEIYGVYEYVLTVIKDPGSQIYVTEWQPPKIKEFSGVMCFYLPFILSMLVLLYSGKRLNLTELLLYVGFAAFAVSSLRNGIWFSLIVGPIVAKQLAHITAGQRYQNNFLTRFLSDQTSKRSLTRLNWIVATIMLIGCITSTPWLQPRLTGQPLWEPDTPVGVFDFIEQERITGRIFHPQSYGDYLVWRLWPEQQSFLDGRVHIFGGPLVQDYLGILADRCWQERLEDYDIRYLLLSVEDESSWQLQKAALASPDWELVYQDDLSFLIRKKSP